MNGTGGLNTAVDSGDQIEYKYTICTTSTENTSKRRPCNSSKLGRFQVLAIPYAYKITGSKGTTGNGDRTEETNGHRLHTKEQNITGLLALIRKRDV